MLAADVIAFLHLEKLPGEGGWFRQTWKSAGRVPSDKVPWEVKGGRPFGTAIYYLLSEDDFSALHRLPGDEIWHFYAGDPVEHLLLFPDGTSEVRFLGGDLAPGLLPQSIVPGGTWQGARLAPDAGSLGWALCGCTMAPGWDRQDLVLGLRSELVRAYPGHRELVRALTRT